MCEDKDSDHNASLCPKGIDLYHGTPVTNICPILETGIRPSATGRLGPGIYFASLKDALNIANHRSKISGVGTIVIKARVNQDKCISSMHPAWAGCAKFKEWCLNSNHYRITAIYLKNGIISGKLYAPTIDVMVDGDCQIKDSINAKSITYGQW